MKTYLIINADDFGLNKAVNEGIANAFVNECVRSVSLMVNGENFNDALKLIQKNPRIDVGLHLNVIRGKATTRLQHLTDSQNFFKSNLVLFFLKSLFKRKKIRQEIYREFENQIVTTLKEKIEISHLDTEKHIHVLPFVMEIIVELAKKYGIRSIRLPFEKMRKGGGIKIRQRLKSAASHFFHKKSTKIIERSGLKYPDFFYGISLSGRFSIENLKETLNCLEPGVNELSCHPATKSPVISSFIDSSRHEELTTLTDPDLLDYINKKGIILTNFKIFYDNKYDS